MLTKAPLDGDKVEPAGSTGASKAALLCLVLVVMLLVIQALNACLVVVMVR